MKLFPSSKGLRTLLLPVAALSLYTACSDMPNQGISLVEDQSQIEIYTDYVLAGRTVDNNRIQSHTITQVLGKIDAKGYGLFESDFLTQFMPAAQLVTENVSVEDIDSLKLLMFVRNGQYIGDSIAPMGLEVYRLNRQLPPVIYSDDNPANYYDPSDLLASKIYSCNAQGQTDSIKKLSYRLIDVKLPLELGKELFTLYLDNPGVFSSPVQFARYFPGIYVRNTFGSGRVVEITSTVMRMYYHTTSTTASGEEKITRHEGTYFAVSPEIVMNNCINFDISEQLEQRIADGEKLIVAPIGKEVEFEFPTLDLIRDYKENYGAMAVINSLALTIPAEEITNDYNIAPPSSLLMVLSSKKDEFFRQNMLTDNVTSFTAAYDSKLKQYRFTGLRNYLIDMLEKGNITPEDYTFTLTPVTIVTESNSNSYESTLYINSIDPYIGAPAMVKLDTDKAQVRFVFSRQVLN